MDEGSKSTASNSSTAARLQGPWAPSGSGLAGCGAPVWVLFVLLVQTFMLPIVCQLTGAQVTSRELCPDGDPGRLPPPFPSPTPMMHFPFTQGKLPERAVFALLTAAEGL